MKKMDGGQDPAVPHPFLISDLSNLIWARKAKFWETLVDGENKKRQRGRGSHL